MDNYVIIASLKREPIYQLINKIQVSCLLISSLPCSALKMHVQSLGMPRDSTIVLKALPQVNLILPCDLTCILKAEPYKLDIKRLSPTIRYLFTYLYIFTILT